MAPTWVVCMAISALMPGFVFRQATRKRAAAVAFAYFVAASAPIVSVSDAYFPGRLALGTLLWTTASAILTVPWIALWHGERRQRFWRIPAALFISALPPVGIIGWASPLTAAGLLFPGMGLAGIAATALAEASWTVHPKTVAAGILTANLLYIPPVQPMGIHTLNSVDFPDPFEKEEAARNAVHHSNSYLTILPEGTVHGWTEATEAYWAETINYLKTTQRTALIGARVPIPNSYEFHNSIITIGASPAERFDQRIPIPIGMWRPFGSADSVPLNLTGPGTLEIGRHRIAILICYEQLLVWPILGSVFERPTIIAGISNAAWTKQTYIPAAQEACLQAWSRLCGIPYVSAVKT
jgi:hypothetical protein